MMTCPTKSQPKKKENLAVLADHSVKLKDREKRDEYQDLARQVKIKPQKRTKNYGTLK